jgi:hypothetical protein
VFRSHHRTAFSKFSPFLRDVYKDPKPRVSTLGTAQPERRALKVRQIDHASNVEVGCVTFRRALKFLLSDTRIVIDSKD